eukprot:m.109527 g.109527  ORF g.109527 m.109527 type:complete len:98 (-) comp15346_c0_seq11:335-628(-)
MPLVGCTKQLFSTKQPRNQRQLTCSTSSNCRSNGASFSAQQDVIYSMDVSHRGFAHLDTWLHPSQPQLSWRCNLLLPVMAGQVLNDYNGIAGKKAEN